MSQMQQHGGDKADVHCVTNKDLQKLELVVVRKKLLWMTSKAQWNRSHTCSCPLNFFSKDW